MFVKFDVVSYQQSQIKDKYLDCVSLAIQYDPYYFPYLTNLAVTVPK